MLRIGFIKSAECSKHVYRGHFMFTDNGVRLRKSNKNWISHNRFLGCKASTEFLREDVNSPFFVEEVNFGLPPYSVFDDLGFICREIERLDQMAPLGLFQLL